MLKPIKTEAQYEEAPARIFELMQLDLESDTEAGDELKTLSRLVKEYEYTHYPPLSTQP